MLNIQWFSVYKCRHTVSNSGLLHVNMIWHVLHWRLIWNLHIWTYLWYAQKENANSYFWRPGRWNISVSRPPTQWCSSVHHLSVNPLSLLLLSSFNPLAAEKCTVLLSLLMYWACIWFLHHYAQGAVGLHATALWIQGRWQNYCTIILPFINLIPIYTYLSQHCRVWLHDPVWEYGDSCNSCRPR